MGLLTQHTEMYIHMPFKFSAYLSQDIVVFFAIETKASNEELLEGHILQALVELVMLWQPLVTKTNDYTASKSLK